MTGGVKRPPLIQFHPFRINLGVEDAVPAVVEKEEPAIPAEAPTPAEPTQAYDVEDGQPDGHTIKRKDS